MASKKQTEKNVNLFYIKCEKEKKRKEGRMKGGKKRRWRRKKDKRK